MGRMKEHFYWLVEKMGFAEMEEEPKKESIQFGECKKSKKKYKTNNLAENPPANSPNKRRKVKHGRG